MEESLNIIPEVRRLHLVNIGPWKDASFDFYPHINVIRGRGASGKSFILKSLLQTTNEQLTARIGSRDGTVTVEYARPEFRYELPAIAISDTVDSASLSVGEKVMRSLGQALQQAKSGCCICIEGEIFGRLDAQHCVQAFSMINQAGCQAIVVLPFSLKPEGFHSPRIFECAYDGATKSSTVQMRDL